MSEPAVTCAVCRTQQSSPPLDWTSQLVARGRQWLCPVCTRANVRSIEGRLDESWW